ncbi:MAG: DUF1232 domain-containing protein [Fimbriimonadaceae bacterium]|nr:DUF1232 domain-containing protein [Fimbriimonadaceae bacterium]
MPKHWRLALPVLTGIVYGLSPIDLIPDLLPLVGLLDDATVGLLVALMLIAQVVKQRQAARVTQPVRSRLTSRP